MAKTILLIGIALLFAVITLSQWPNLEEWIEAQRLVAAEDFPIVGESAPAFDLPDLEGKIHSLDDYLGRPLVIDFWATWCNPCKKALPLFEEFHSTHGDRITLLAICSGSPLEKATEIVQEASLTFPVLYDEDKAIARAYQPQAEGTKRKITLFPFTVFVDAGGTVVYAKAGSFARLDELLDLLDRLGFPIDQL